MKRQGFPHRQILQISQSGVDCERPELTQLRDLIACKKSLRCQGIFTGSFLIIRSKVNSKYLPTECSCLEKPKGKESGKPKLLVDKRPCPWQVTVEAWCEVDRLTPGM
jgi:hypothetical protein